MSSVSPGSPGSPRSQRSLGCLMDPGIDGDLRTVDSVTPGDAPAAHEVPLDEQQLMAFRDAVVQSGSFDHEDVAKVDDALVHLRTIGTRARLTRILDDRAAVLKEWGTRVDFQGHEDLVAFFYAKQKDLEKHLGGADAPSNDAA